MKDDRRRMTRKEHEWVAIELFLFLLGFLFGTIYASSIIKPDEHITICDYTMDNISEGAVSIKFLIDKAGDYNEVVEFCRSKGYDRGTQSFNSMSIYCDSDEGRYKYFSIMRDFAEYLYNKYNGLDEKR